MEFTRQRSTCPALLLLLAVCVGADFIEPRQPVLSMRSLSEAETRLPCRYQGNEGQTVVQVAWYKNDEKEPIITAHITHGQTVSGPYSDRVRFESSRPREDAALLIPSTEASDQGSFRCTITTFPDGNFERRITLTVWILPISSVQPVILSEGVSYRAAATCRAVGRPAPVLSWDTELTGQAKSRSSEDGATVSTQFLLHPLRSMDGKRLDCLVEHPGLDTPRRIQNRLMVHYPPDTSISGPREWFDGMEGVELLCDSRGNPAPHNYTWTWRGGPLPDGTLAVAGKLVFRRPLRLNDSGMLECSASNRVGVGRAEIHMQVLDKSERKMEPPTDDQMLIIIGVSAGALVLLLIVTVLLVNRHHRHRNSKLEAELNQKTEEINSFSRQASFRRLNSVSTDPRVHPEDYAMLRVDSRMKSSQTSLERPIYRGSQSTLGGRWGGGGGGEVDELGRPVVWLDGTTSFSHHHAHTLDTHALEQDERRRRVESYLKNSNMSLDSGLPSSLIPLKAAQPDDGVLLDGPNNNTSMDASPGSNQGNGTPESDGDGGVEGEEGPREPDKSEDEEERSSQKISEALTNHFYYSNGVLRPKPHSNAILLHPKGQII